MMHWLIVLLLFVAFPGSAKPVSSLQPQKLTVLAPTTEKKPAAEFKTTPIKSAERQKPNEPISDKSSSEEASASPTKNDSWLLAWIAKWLSDPVAFFSSALFSVVVLQWIWMVRQERVLKESINVGTRAALAAESTVKSMEATAARQLRAHVFVDLAGISNVANPSLGLLVPTPNPAAVNFPNDGPMINLTAKNFGQTPAYEVMHWAAADFAPFPLVGKLPGRIRGQPGSITKSTLGPGSPISKFLTMPRPLSPAQVAQLQNGTHAIYVNGIITYRDVFGVRQRTRYRLMHVRHGGTIGISTSLTGCQEGNDAT